MLHLHKLHHARFRRVYIVLSAAQQMLYCVFSQPPRARISRLTTDLMQLLKKVQINISEENNFIYFLYKSFSFKGDTTLNMLRKKETL